MRCDSRYSFARGRARSTPSPRATTSRFSPGKWMPLQPSGSPRWMPSPTIASIHFPGDQGPRTAGFACLPVTWAGWPPRAACCAAKPARRGPSSTSSRCMWPAGRLKWEWKFVCRVRVSLKRTGFRPRRRPMRPKISALHIPSGFNSDPQLRYAIAGFGRNRKQLLQLQSLLQRQQVACAFVAAKPVNLCGHHRKIAFSRAEPVKKLPVAVLGRNVRVHQADTQLERGADGQVGLDELRPPRRHRLRYLGVAIAWQVGKHQFAPPAWVQKSKEVDGPCAPRCRRDFGRFFPGELVQQAGFAYVRAAKKGNLRHIRIRKL